MSISQPIELIISFAGGGILAALLSWARAERTESTARSHELARLRLENLYGPLYFLTENNRRLSELAAKINDLSRQELIDKNWAHDERTQAFVNAEIEKSTDISNLYISQIRENNQKICEILSTNYSYILQSDSDIFQKFVLNHLRMEREFPANLGLTIPFDIFKKLGILRFIHPEFNDMVRKRVNELQCSIAK